MSLQLWGIIFCSALAVIALALFFALGFLVRDQLFVEDDRDRSIFRWALSAGVPPEDLGEAFRDVVGEVVRGRNEFLSIYGQLLVATVVVAVIAILLLVKVIGASAGLPIITGIVAFTLGKSPVGQAAVRQFGPTRRG
jgi:hypothetical protein